MHNGNGDYIPDYNPSDYVEHGKDKDGSPLFVHKDSIRAERNLADHFGTGVKSSSGTKQPPSNVGLIGILPSDSALGSAN